jgi:transposase InsO family protein
MDVHQNARLTPHSRALLVEQIRGGGLIRHASARFGVSERTVRKWVRRFEAEGSEGLRDRSSRPRHTPKATVRELALAVVALRRQRLTFQSIAEQLQLSRSTVARICARAGLNRLAKLEPAPPVRRYERAEPGELLHLDTKKLGRIVRPGHRVTGDRRDSVKRAGWDYVHVAIDDHSRISYVQIFPDEQGSSAAAFLRLAVAYYAALGVVIREVLTDNGGCYISRPFAEACRDLGIVHRFTRPYTPRTNGKAERFIQTALREWAYARSYRDSVQRSQELPRWLHAYNWHRPHMSLAGQPPMLRLGLNRNNLLRLHN